MRVTVKIHGTTLKTVSPREITVEVGEGATVGNLLMKISNSLESDISKAIHSGRIWKEAMIFLNGLNIIYLKGADTILEDGSTLAMIPAVVGG